MLVVHRFWLSSSLLVLCLVGCDGNPPVEPGIQAAGTGSGSTLQAPSNTKVVAVSASQFDVSWQNNSTSESGLEVHRSTAGASGAFALLVSTGAGVTGYSDGGLTGSTQYCYRVRAFMTTGSKTSYSQFSTAACATTPPSAPPAAPSKTEAWPIGSTAVSMWWLDNSTTEDGFRVERSLDSGSSWTTAGTLGRDMIDFSDYGRTSEQPVCYRIIAFNAKGDSPPSNSACTTPPAGPTNLAVAAVDPLTLEVDLTWRDNSAVEDGYQVWICLSGYDFCSWFATLPADSTSYRFTWDGQPDRYVVVATKDGGNSDASNLVTPTIP